MMHTVDVTSGAPTVTHVIPGDTHRRSICCKTAQPIELPFGGRFEWRTEPLYVSPMPLTDGGTLREWT